MSAFGGLILTNKGRNLQAKAQTGVQLNFTRISVGDGDLAGTSILDLNTLKHEVKSLAITKLKTMTGGKAVVGTVFSNETILAGFYWRELGVFAQDPDLGEILYCYGNAGVNAEYIPAGGGPDIIEKSIDVVTIVGNAANVTATIESSLIYTTAQELNDAVDEINILLATKETPEGAQAKATAAQEAAIASAATALALKAPLASPALTGTPTAPTPAVSTNTTQLATTAFVKAVVAALVDSSPAALDTLNELAAALGDDPNFATTITNLIATKADQTTVTAHQADYAQLVEDVVELEYNVYQLYLQNYYDAKFPLKKGLFFDGFANDSMIDTVNSTVILNLTSKKIKAEAESYISQTSDGNPAQLGRTTAYTKHAQCFTVADNISVKAVKLKLSKVGSPADNLICNIYTSDGNIPKTTLMGTSTTILKGTSVTATGAEYSFDFSSLALTPGKYAITLERSGAIDSTNYYEIFLGGGDYSEGRPAYHNGSSWLTSIADLYFVVSINLDAGTPISPVYQSLEQVFTQNTDNAVVYVKSKTVAESFVSVEMAIYTEAETFEVMALESTRDLGEGYQEDKFVCSTATAGNKVKVRMKLNRPSTSSIYEVSNYGVILGVA